MDKGTLIVLAIIGLLMFSCKPHYENETKKVTYYHYFLSVFPSTDKRNLKSKQEIYLDTVIQNGKTKFIYHDSLVGGDTLNLSYFIKNDSLFYFDYYCEIIDTLQFEYDDKLITLYKSNFDDEYENDEESHIFWNMDYGIIGIHNYSSGPLIVLDHDSIENFATEDFYKFIVRKERDKLLLLPIIK